MSQAEKKDTGQLKKLLVYVLRSRGLRNRSDRLLFEESVVEQGKAYHKMPRGYGPLQLHDLGLNPRLLLLPFWIWLLLSKCVSRNNVSCVLLTCCLSGTQLEHSPSY